MKNFSFEGRKKDIVVFLLILLVNSAFMLVRYISDLDEIWNYNFARNIADGLLPYADFNIIITPLYPAMVAIFLKLIANELIVARLVAIIMFTGTVFLGYKIIDRFSKNKWIPIIGTLIILFIYKYNYWGDYNFAVLFITIIIIYLETKNNRKNFLLLNVKYDVIVGIIAGLAIITKQTTGLCLAFTFVMYKWLFIRNKNDLKNVIKISLLRGIGVLVPVITFLIYLLVTGSMTHFIDYAFLGLSNFSSSFPYSELLSHPAIEFMFKALAVFVPIAFAFNAYMIWKTRDRYISILFIFSLQNMIVIYPLCDVVHYIVGSFPILITTIYSICKIAENKLLEKDNQILADIAILSMLAFAAYAIITLTYYVKNMNNDLKHFAGVPVSEGLHNSIVKITTFIKEQEEQNKRVYIINLDAALPMIVADKYNKNFDLLPKGNTGAKGEEGIIEDIKNMNNAVFLITEEPSNNRQSPEKIRCFIKDNYTKVGNVSYYSVYM